MSRSIARFAVIVAAAQILNACATTSPPAARKALVPACRASEVLYCADNGSRATEGLCTCLSQSAAKATVDSL
ncbi:MAG TPA: hypothetical protein VG994_10715 [Steroidobacteraceae bacterium]|nr:hypothetical protein [Steroidobacteraceae bacterium]